MSQASCWLPEAILDICQQTNKGTAEILDELIELHKRVRL